MEPVTLFSLPANLLGRLWPPERVVMGARTCLALRKQLATCAEEVTLRNIESAATADEVQRTIQCFEQCALSFWWNPAGPQCWDAFLRGVELSDAASRLSALKADKVLYWGGSRPDPRLGPAGATNLAEILVRSREIKQLGLSSHCIGPAGAGSLLDALATVGSCTQLDLSDNDLAEAGAQALGAKLQACPALTHLDLRDNILGAEGGTALAGALPSLHQLSFLDLSYCMLEAAGTASLAGKLGGCSALARLRLSDNRIGAAGAEAMARALGACSALRDVDLSCNDIGEEGGTAFARGLAEVDALHVTHLDLSENELGPAGVSAVAGALSGRAEAVLRGLHVRANAIGDEGMTALAEALARCSRLETLGLGMNGVGPAGAGKVAEWLGACGGGLVSLDMESDRVGARGARRLGAGLRGCVQLRNLELGGNEVGAGVGEMLEEMLRGGVTGLTSLGLARNKLEAEGLRAVAAAAAAWTRLERLSVGGNGVGDGEVGEIARMVGGHRRLERVGLKGGFVGDVGATALGQALEARGARAAPLKLDLRANRVRDAGATQLAAALDRGRQAGAELDLQLNEIGGEGAAVLESLAGPGAPGVRVRVTVGKQRPVSES